MIPFFIVKLMLQPHIFTFLKKLQKHNHKEWMDENRKMYQQASTEFQVFINVVIAHIATFDPSIADLEAKQCVFRINRDIRFSKNKDPYKNNFGAYICHKGKKGGAAGYYIHIEPGKSFIAAGIWMPEAPVLAQIRQEIDYQFGDFKKIINHAAFRKTYTSGLDSSDQLSRPPKGYEADNPAVEYLKMKSYVVIRSFSDQELESKDGIKNIVSAFKIAHPLIRFINGASE